ncbi:hypothetical protein THASP1DRAFT_30553 [Thamnocephalis sphaerospora]|uniref:Uncharacterized protein n=1 Tax=Thamnocephalis sphaerospora TaxID=78915 RepID=A0A4P9XNT3_9FUNG|nr:hypothetical protein THASP1DRAFT_30553 [Thamnocephalis sphaerospora]|eukprot:RKP07628.1 hypothetical protein THASP1DRAFT_30553 [Thamnocephalis sphaerospora]
MGPRKLRAAIIIGYASGAIAGISSGFALAVLIWGSIPKPLSVSESGSYLLAIVIFLAWINFLAFICFCMSLVLYISIKSAAINAQGGKRTQIALQCVLLGILVLYIIIYTFLTPFTELTGQILMLLALVFYHAVSLRSRDALKNYSQKPVGVTGQPGQEPALHA